MEGRREGDDIDAVELIILFNFFEEVVQSKRCMIYGIAV